MKEKHMLWFIGFSVAFIFAVPVVGVLLNDDIIFWVGVTGCLTLLLGLGMGVILYLILNREENLEEG